MCQLFRNIKNAICGQKAVGNIRHLRCQDQQLKPTASQQPHKAVCCWAACGTFITHPGDSIITLYIVGIHSKGLHKRSETVEVYGTPQCRP